MVAKRFILFGVVWLLVWGCHSGERPKNVEIVRSDKQLTEAVAKAQSTLPTLLKELEHPMPGDQFVILARFPARGSFEHLYVDHLKLKGNELEGVLAVNPIGLEDKTLKKGSTVTVAKDQIDDWMIRRNGTVAGGFTERVRKR